MGRAPCCDKENVKKGPWSPEEDAKLKDYIEQQGTGGNWIALPQKIGLKRCGKSCRLRWLNYLRPNIKHGGFSEEEDQIISSLYISIGSRWSIIAAQLPGRTDNDIKNYWNTRLKKKLLGRPRTSGARRLSGLTRDPQDPQGMDDKTSSQTLTTSALERMQLHMKFQSLHSPFSFYANAALWPKHHPLGERILQTQYDNIDDIPIGWSTDNLTRPWQKEKSNDLAPISMEPSRANPTYINQNKEEGNSGNGLSSLASSVALNGGFDSISSAMASKESSIEQSNASFHMVDGIETELDSLLYAKTGCLIGQENQLSEFDCFKHLLDSKDSIIWWANDFDTKSSSNSWNSASILHPEGMFQDYLLGYDL